jgi:methylase of polypeptide subunit release factors
VSDAGVQSLALVQRLIADAARFLRRDGWLLCEFGRRQAKPILASFARSRRYAEARVILDDDGDERIVAARSLG